MSETTRQPPVGIDLGTTFSAVAFLDETGRPETIRNSEGDLTTPSAVFFDHKQPIVGIEAMEAGLLEPDRLAIYAKRDVGEQYYEKTIRGKHLPAEVIQALVLRKLKSDAELKLGHVRQAVITVPAFFNEPCRKATQDAGKLAGLEVLDIINEPTAAAITYGVAQGFLTTDGTVKQSEQVLVYDLGGGTFDVTVMQIEAGNFNTIATAGDVYLGGIDWDQRIVDFIVESFQAEHGINLHDDPQATQELLRKANQTKHALTQRESVSVAFAHDGRRLRTELTQAEFAKRSADLVERTLMTVQLVLDDANIEWSNLTRLILVGGSTRMPMIRDELERLSGMELDRSLSPDEAVSHGAALYAGMLMAGKHDQSGISVSNVNSHDLGVLAVDPKSGSPRRQVMIPRNSKLPARKTVRFRTHSDNQANVKIEVVEGGDDRGINATKIGQCVVDDLPRGTPKGTNVDVRFDYTPDGRLTVHASLPEVDRKLTMTLDRAAGLEDRAIERWAKLLDEELSDAKLAELSEGTEDSGYELTASEASRPEPRDDLAEQSGAVTGDHALNESNVGDSGEVASSSPSRENIAAVLGVSPDAALNRHPSSGSDASSSNKTHASIDSLAGLVAEDKPKFSVDDAKQLSIGETPKVIQEKPQLDTGVTSEVVKADRSDFAALAALGGGASPAKTPSPDVPTIQTETPGIKPSSEPKPKKAGGLFGRKKKG
ncbi:MAG: Hsp70 family protein [Planctomycetota bacterium]